MTTEPTRPVRIPTGTYDRLSTEAAARGLPPAWLAGRLITEGLDNLLPAEQFRLTRPPEVT